MLLVYAEYAKTSNVVAVTIYLIMLIGAQTAQIGEQFVHVSFFSCTTWKTFFWLTSCRRKRVAEAMV